LADRLIRPALPGDLVEICAFVRAAYEIYVERMGRKPAPMLADYRALTAAGRLQVAELDGRLAGALVLFPSASTPMST
jgi:hypothetical protein